MAKKKTLIIIGIFAGTAVLVSVFVGLIFAFCMQSKAPTDEKIDAEEMQREKRLSARSNVVYCIREIKEGSLIKKEDLENRLLEDVKIPEDALKNIRQAAGHRAKYGIDNGQLVSVHDIAP